jgi:hypothetical protein
MTNTSDVMCLTVVPWFTFDGTLVIGIKYCFWQGGAKDDTLKKSNRDTRGMKLGNRKSNTTNSTRQLQLD